MCFYIALFHPVYVCRSRVERRVTVVTTLTPVWVRFDLGLGVTRSTVSGRDHLACSLTRSQPWSQHCEVHTTRRHTAVMTMLLLLLMAMLRMRITWSMMMRMIGDCVMISTLACLLTMMTNSAMMTLTGFKPRAS